MIFGPIGSLAIGAVPDPVVVSAGQAGGASLAGGSRWDDRFREGRMRRRVDELTEAEMIAILLAADEEYYN